MYTKARITNHKVKIVNAIPGTKISYRGKYVRFWKSLKRTP